MLTPARSLALYSESGAELPRVPALSALYQRGNRPRFGEVSMIAGRSGSQKSGFALWYTLEMKVPTLYFSADMAAQTAAARLAASVTGDPKDIVEAGINAGGEHQARYFDALRENASHIEFSFGNPITWSRVDQQLQAYIELHDAFPGVMVFDNLMDIEGCETEYVEQMQAMSSLTELARETGAAVLVMHHASDKSWQAQSDPWKPPGRQEIKNGLAEKPAMTLGVGLDRTSFMYYIAPVKDRNGPDDPTGRTFIALKAEPDKTQFHAPSYGY